MTDTSAIRLAYDQAEPAVTHWPDPTALRGSLLPVPELSASLLPSQLRPWVEDIAERMNVPLDFVGVPALVGASSLVGARMAVRPTMFSDWTEAGNLWGCIVGSPGQGKTPAVSQALKPLADLEASAKKAYLSELAHFEDQAAAFGLQREAAERRARKAFSDGNADMATQACREMREPTPPTETRFIVCDATVEKLGEITRDSPLGILYHRDEVLTLFDQLGHHNSAGARSYFLSAWRGLDAYSWDRIQRGSIYIPRANLSLFGTTQPDRMASFVRSVIRDGDDGLLARVQLLAWPDPIDEFRIVDRRPHEAAREEAWSCFRQLAQLTAGVAGAAPETFQDGDVPFLRFQGDAVDAFNDFRADNHRKVSEGGLPNVVQSHLNKYPGLVARMALLMHLTGGGYGPIGVEAVEAAIQWARYLEPHAMRAYDSANIDDAATARALLQRIKKGDLPATFTARDVYKNHWSGLGKGPALDGALNMLSDCDWLKPTTLVTGGRPSTKFQVNPKTWTQQIAAAA